MKKVITVSRHYEVTETESMSFRIRQKDLDRFTLETGGSIEDEQELFVWCYVQDFEVDYDCQGARTETDTPSVYTTEVWKAK